ncbi:hypothetical protein BB559_005919 [Furculomyces boomerangus]|uniref:Uncharacterized protein n=2 Tax=Harpellales TaxID=61421 RepID=A0A2T9Y1U9_9FUNG|nr:hypothetical protein BB559_006560 [Furculomyces boomerangus]PVU87704.1 hypothetical protein BB559_005919 [Furculomyces boomerangus]PWA01693.1 hypothetical protein BB558_002196 [Smittium angustum]
MEMHMDFEKIEQERLKNQEIWSDKLLGKYIQRVGEPQLSIAKADIFNESDLPEPYRILMPDSIATMDFRSNRLNVLLNNSEKVTGVQFG